MADRDLLRSVTTKICEEELSARPGGGDVEVDDRLWRALCEGGLTRISVPESMGGSGGDLSDALTVLQVIGGCGASVPVAETSVLAGWLLSRSGHELPDGPLTTAVGHGDDEVELTRRSNRWVLSGRAVRVPWARLATRMAWLIPTREGDLVVSLDPQSASITPATNLAGEPRDSLRFVDLPLDPAAVKPAPDGLTLDALRLRGAASRVALLSGAMSRVVERTVDYAGQRRQFGQPINRFQAVQNLLVRLAEEAACAQLAADVAIEASGDEPAPFETAISKVITSEAAGVVAGIAHQIHGAIGMTQEFPLHHLTRRLWSWRDEFGSERAWSRVVGSDLVASGAEGLWPRIAGGPSRPS